MASERKRERVMREGGKRKVARDRQTDRQRQRDRERDSQRVTVSI